jgi:hypothetical protein
VKVSRLLLARSFKTLIQSAWLRSFRDGLQGNRKRTIDTREHSRISGASMFANFAAVVVSAASESESATN